MASGPAGINPSVLKMRIMSCHKVVVRLKCLAREIQASVSPDIYQGSSTLPRIRVQQQTQEITILPSWGVYSSNGGQPTSVQMNKTISVKVPYRI